MSPPISNVNFTEPKVPSIACSDSALTHVFVAAFTLTETDIFPVPRYLGKIVRDTLEKWLCCLAHYINVVLFFCLSCGEIFFLVSLFLGGANQGAAEGDLY